MLVGNKVCLLPNKEQEQVFWKYVDAYRFVYNFALAYKIEQYNNFGVIADRQDVRNELALLKKQQAYSWLSCLNFGNLDKAIDDLFFAYKLFFNSVNNFPNFKKKGRCKKSFYVRYDRVRSVDNRHIKIPGVATPVRTSEHCVFRKNTIQNTRISFDGKHWYLSYTYECSPCVEELSDVVIGIDLGINNLAVCSNGLIFCNINNSDSVKHLIARRDRLKRRLSDCYNKNDGVKSNNIAKLSRKVMLIERRLRNIRRTYVHTVTMQIVKTKPSTIVIEDLNVSGLMKNGKLANAIQSQSWYFFRVCLTYKAKFYGGIEIVVVPRTYPSSKKCSSCGTIRKSSGLDYRVFHCTDCGLTLDRDLNAAYNLRNFVNSAI